MSTGPEELSLETIAPEDADLIDLRYEGVDLPLDQNDDPTQVELACGEHLGVVALEGGYEDGGFIDLHFLGEPFQGESAYDVAVRNGFNGSEAAWLESLVGPESPNAVEARAAQEAAEAAADRAEAATLNASASETAAEGHASASSAARAQAQAYRDEAGLHAQASLDFLTQTETATGQALAYRNQSAESFESAESAAQRAEIAEGVSTTMRDQAEGFSQASATSSQTAEGYMDESRVEAQAARDAHLLAETSRENSESHAQASYDASQLAIAKSTEAGEYAEVALTSRLAAEAARDDTDQIALAVIEDRDIVIARADEAGEYAEAAESHRLSALTSAGAAQVSAENSAISETNADSSRVAAEAARDIAVSSSGDAADALAATISYRDQAEIFSDNAGDYATAANSARVAAESARDTANGAASAAATSASSASSSQTAAASSASAANTSATNAATSAANASTFATNASNSATTAAGHAATATTQAGLAATSAGLAGGSATAANTSAGNAATSATNAGNSATAANTSAVNAASSFAATNTLAALQFPDRYDGTTGSYFAGYPYNSPSTITPKPSNATQAGYGPVYDMTGQSGADDFSTVGALPATPGRIYKAEIEFQRTASTGTPNSGTYMGLVFRTLGADFASDSAYMGGIQVSPNGSVQTLSYMVSDIASGPGIYNWPSGTVWLRAYARQEFGSLTSQTIRIRRLTVTDVTEQQAALSSANAAATSASAASTSASAAGTSATAANTSATNAATSAGAASTSATNASNSATTASGHAATASTQAGLAATSASNASSSASAANTSAGTASTQATNAGNSATAAAASQVAAASSYDAARATAAITLPRDFTQEVRFWTSGLSGDAATVGPIYGTFPTVAGIGKVWQGVVGYSDGVVLPRALLPMTPGTKWRFKYKARYVALPGGGEPIFIYLRGTDASFAYGGGFSLDTIGGAGVWNYGTSWEEIEGFYTVPATPPYPYFRPEVRAGGTGTGQIQVAYFEVEDVTASSAAAASATAAATSASSASTSASAAGSSATAASGSATAAATSASSAGTFATNSSTSATGAAGSATTAGTHATTASTAAGTATTQASNASASAAAASTSAIIAAGVGTGHQNPNSTFALWSNPAAPPTGWALNYGLQSYNTRITGDNGNGYALDVSRPGGAQHELSHSDLGSKVIAPGYYVLEADVQVISGSWGGSGLRLETYNGATSYITGFYLRFDVDPDTNGNVLGLTPAARRYSFRKLIQVTNTSTEQYYLGLSTGGIIAADAAAGRHIVRKAGFRPATNAEVASLVALPALSATVSSVSAVAIDAQGKANAINEVTLDVNGYISGTRSVNNGTDSSFEVLASVFGIRDPGSGERTEYRSGIWYVYSPSNSTRTMYGKAFGGSDKLVWWTGPDSITEGSETKANAYVYMSQTSPRFGGSDTPGSFSVTQSHTGRVGTRFGAGSVTTSTVTLTPIGATGTVTYTWTNVFGDSSIGATSPTSAATAFNGSVAAYQQKQAQFAWTATDSGTGKTVTGYCSAAIIDVT